MPRMFQQMRDRFAYFSPQLSMPSILMEDKWQIYLFLQTIKNALSIYGRYATYWHISLHN